MCRRRLNVLYVSYPFDVVLKGWSFGVWYSSRCVIYRTFNLSFLYLLLEVNRNLRTLSPIISDELPSVFTHRPILVFLPEDPVRRFNKELEQPPTFPQTETYYVIRCVNNLKDIYIDVEILYKKNSIYVISGSVTILFIYNLSFCILMINVY